MRKFMIIVAPHPHFSRIGTLEDEDESYVLLSLEADWRFSEQLVCIPKWHVTEL